jgi:hypothetical protein
MFRNSSKTGFDPPQPKKINDLDRHLKLAAANSENLANLKVKAVSLFGF